MKNLYLFNLSMKAPFKIGDKVTVARIEGDYIFDSPYVISGETDNAWILKLGNKEIVFKKSVYKLELIRQ